MFKVTFLPMNIEVAVEAGKVGGNLLQLALANNVEIDHACGGVCACATCHVLIQEGEQSLAEASEEEEDMLENAPGLQSISRLACCCIPDGSQDLVVEIPNWNRNLVKERES